MLDWAMERGLREIEKENNWYWMEAIKSFSLVVDQQGYSVYTSTSNGLNIPAYKDSQILFAQDTDSDAWDEVPGPEEASVVQADYLDTDEGFPKVWTKAESSTDVTMKVWPPKPDATYAMQLHYYNWTSLPTDPTSEAHEVLKRWPEALIYLATEQAVVATAKDISMGQYWRTLYEGSELTKMTRYHQDRAQSHRGDLVPLRGSRAKNYGARLEQGYRF